MTETPVAVMLVLRLGAVGVTDDASWLAPSAV